MRSTEPSIAELRAFANSRVRRLFIISVRVSAKSGDQSTIARTRSGRSRSPAGGGVAK